VVYHWVAWNAVPGKTFVGFYNGDATDNRNITGIGFQPKYLVVKPIYNNNTAFGPTFTPPGSQRYYAMVGDSMYNFTAGPATNHTHACRAAGFQIGSATSINRTFADCSEDGPGCAYFYVAFNALAPDTTSLGATESGGNITVTAANSFELTFDSNYGGGVQKFYDLAEDPSRANDLRGGLDSANGVGVKTIFHPPLPSGGGRDTPGDDPANSADTYGRWNGSPPKLDLLEATPVRVRVRQEAFYSKVCDTQGTGCTPGTLGGVKGVGDFSVYPSGRLAIRWNQNITANVVFTNRDLALGVYSECPPASACANLTAYSSSASIASGGANPAADTFLLAKREVGGRRTDFLRILFQNWAAADQTGFDQNVAFLDWRDFPVTSPLTTSESWSFLDYF